MLIAYIQKGNRLQPVPLSALEQAEWIDLMAPTAEEIRQVEALGFEIPSLGDMEEIELSNRIYHEGATDYMTVVLPGETAGGARAAMPVAFILAPDRLLTVRHHAPRPFATFPERADRAILGCSSPDRLFVGLIEEVVGRLADLLEGSQNKLETISDVIFASNGDTPDMRETLVVIGRESAMMSMVRIGLVSISRALAFYTARLEDNPDAQKLKAAVKAQLRDIQSVELHADFLSGRVSLTLDATLGLINLEQNATVRILSVVAALFLPPTLIASIYGMNFTNMPELDQPWGYPMSLGLMAGSALLTFLFLKWKKWI
ncbi:magnesium transporter CorA family protein [Paracoccus sp. TK19116]|uniref:Magnesium transporter CorA family protein n=1 Tax=Paracoccus albicereus TaxID=2922394 RepID=A0ABT1MSC7_9RHOB|nr:magnesium transporter CorA family protein [Paracoccus albicereus]MCQ0971203.1 magnesium transporter CorA family protein [Paracoccus albicereus]